MNVEEVFKMLELLSNTECWNYTYEEFIDYFRRHGININYQA